jgi:hypothetical protein
LPPSLYPAGQDRGKPGVDRKAHSGNAYDTMVKLPGRVFERCCDVLVFQNRGSPRVSLPASHRMPADQGYPTP